MIMKIKPLDTLFFKDGKPFNMGEETWTNSIFPPSPSVFYGAIRTLYFSNHMGELKLANQDADPTKNIIIKEIFLMDDKDNILLSLPMDTVKFKDKKPVDEKERKAYVLSLIDNNLTSGLPGSIEKILMFDENRKVENVENGYVNDIDFEEYLNGKSYFNYKLLKDKNSRKLYDEPKIGIARSNLTHSSEESKLYRVDMKRLSNLAFLVNYEGIDIPNKGLMKLGGEAKAVSYEKYEEQVYIEAPSFSKDDTIFKIYISTPAIFEKGWIPRWIEENTLIGVYKDIKVKLITASIGKPMGIGGFDMKNKKPKPMYKAVPSGSVYYFRLLEGNIDNVIKYFHGKTISDVYRDQGFGVSYVGKQTDRRVK